MSRVRKKNSVLIIGSLALTAAVVVGVIKALYSPLFAVKVVEIEDGSGNYFQKVPVSSQQIYDLAAIQVGSENLFSLDLMEIEGRLLSNPWIQRVRIQKRFPQTLSITVGFRKPKALIQNRKQGTLSYVDVEGNVFGSLDLSIHSDITVISSEEELSESRIKKALRFIDLWKETEPNMFAQLSSIYWDTKKGFRIVAIYPMIDKKEVGRAIIELGQEIDTNMDPENLDRLGKVLRYLAGNSISAKRIWLSDAKKIVVKRASNS